MKQSVLGQAIHHFLKTTTLHGFKYLRSTSYLDRSGWIACCCVSACCAVVLCTVLWARFLQVPALLVLQDLRSTRVLDQPMPEVAVCPSPARVASIFVHQLSVSSNKTKWIPVLLNRLLRGKPAAKSQLLQLENLLAVNNLTLPELLVNHMPPCADLTRMCRWQNTMIPCDRLFKKELTQWGVCCVMRADRLQNKLALGRNFETNENLILSLQCFNGTVSYGCEFYTKYRGEEWAEPVFLASGYNYFAQITFTSVENYDTEKLVDGTWVSDSSYSRSQCLINCKESICGCSDPLRAVRDEELVALPPCPVSRMNCLKMFKIDNTVCNCLPSRRKVITDVYLESSPIASINNTFNPMYKGLNSSSGVLLDIRIRITGSKLFNRIASESWVTLLSSLGGVFNMFIGVGLFSALELLFLLLVRLPVAFKRSAEIDHVASVH